MSGYQEDRLYRDRDGDIWEYFGKKGWVYGPTQAARAENAHRRALFQVDELPPWNQPYTVVDDTSEADMVNHPPHYKKHWLLPRECLSYTRIMGFDQGNAFKYLYRFEDKTSPKEDLDKAVFYLQDLTETLYPDFGVGMRVHGGELKELATESRRLFEEYLDEAHKYRTREPESPLREDAMRLMLALLDNSLTDVRGLLPTLIRSAEAEYEK